jgi:hypothetical protein
MIVFSHVDYDGANIIPSIEVTPRCAYSTIDAAENALNKLIANLTNYSPALYGEVYPIENTTARNELTKRGSAVYGWTTEVTDDGDTTQYGICIIMLAVN